MKNSQKIIVTIVFIFIFFSILSQTFAQLSNSNVRSSLPEGITSKIKSKFATSATTNPNPTSYSSYSTDVVAETVQSNQISLQAPTLSSNFTGLKSTDNSPWVFPPDGALAVGPQHIVEFVNRVGRIFDKTGATLSTSTLNNFFIVQSDAVNNFDPKIFYDNQSGRFFATYVAYNSTNGLIYLAVSQTNNPTGNWLIYPFTIFQDLPDYPGMGVTDDKVTISYNRFNINTGNYVGAQMLVIEKADLLNGSATAYWNSLVYPAYPTIRPAQSLTSTSTQWMVTDGGGIHLMWITGTPRGGNVSLSQWASSYLPSWWLGSMPDADQLGSGTLIDTGDGRILDAVWKDNKFWFSANFGCIPSGDSTRKACFFVGKIDTNVSENNQNFNYPIYSTSGEHNYYPAIRPDSNNNLIIVFSSSSINKYVEVRLVGFSQNNFTNSVLIKSGEAPFTVTSSDGRTRWGDYFSAAIDPSNPKKVWVEGEYAKIASGIDPSNGGWGTWIAENAFSINFTNQNGSTTAELGSPINLSAFWRGDIKLDKAILSTNETGSFKNYTDGTYSSPLTFNSNSGWSNFTWLNSSLSAGSIVSWKVYANDTEDDQNVTNTFNFRIVDTTPPKITNITQSNDTIYQKNKIYNFTSTIFDYSGIDKVYFEWNGSINVTNSSYQQVNSTTRIYFVNETDLSVGNYTYRWIANDTFGNQNSTQNSFLITKATPSVYLQLNGSYSNINYTQGQIANITAFTNYSDSMIIVNLFSNFTGTIQPISSGQDPIINLTNTSKLSVGNYEIDTNTSSNQNYTSSQTNFTILSVLPIPPTVSITNYSIPTMYNPIYSANFTVVWNSSVGISNSFIEENFTGTLRNSTMTNNTSNYSYSIILPAGVFQYRFIANDTYNGFGSTNITTLTINRGTQSLILTPSNQTITYNTLLNESCTTSDKDARTTINFFRNVSNIGTGFVLATPQNNFIYPTGVNTVSCDSFGTANYTEQTMNATVVVNPQQISLHISLNNIENNQTLEFPVMINATAWKPVSEGSLIFLKNGTQITNPNIFLPSVLGVWNYTVILNGASNHTANSVSEIATLQDNLPPFISNSTISSNISTVNNRTTINATTTSNTSLQISTNGNLSGSTIIIDKYPQDSVTSNTGFSALNKSIEILASDDVTNSLSWALINISYTSSDLTTSGLVESTLRIWFYNSTSGTWSKFDSPYGGVDTVNKIVWANTTHFSLYSVFGNKLTPTLTMTASPSWTVTKSTQTTVSCSADTNQVTPIIYKNNAQVANPDIETLPVATYSYVCNNTETANYTSTSVSNTLTINSVSSSGGGSSSSGTGGGGGGGGGGGSSLAGETNTPIETVSIGQVVVSLPSISPGTTAIVPVSNSDTGINELDVNVNNAVTSGTLNVIKVTTLPSAPSGTIYQQLSISHIGFNDTDIASATIKFSVTKSWLTSNNIDQTTVKLQRYVNDVWTILPTTKITDDSNNVYYAAVTPGFSYFAITGQQATTSTTNQTNTTPTNISQSLPTQNNILTSFAILVPYETPITIIATVVIVAGLIIYWKKLFIFKKKRK